MSPNSHLSICSYVGHFGSDPPQPERRRWKTLEVREVENIVSPKPRITVLVADHNPIFLEGIAALIRSQQGMSLAGTARTVDELLLIQSEKAAHIVVIDLEFPGFGAFGAIRKILADDPTARVIGLLTHEKDVAGSEAIILGAAAVLAKDQIGDELVPTIWRTLSPGE